MADVLSKLDEISEMIESAKAMPLSSSCVINRSDLLTALDQVREMLPTELATAARVVADRDGVLAQGRAEADRIVAAAQQERARMLAGTDVAQEAAAQAEVMLAEARESAREMRAEVEDYVDARLANFEIVLHKTLSAVERGREKLRGRHELDTLRGRAGDDDEPTPLP
jgi:cell division septum initiation protein DivIVA